MSDPDRMTETDAAGVDAYVRAHFGAEAPDPTPDRSATASEHRRADEDEQFAAYMRHHFARGGDAT